MSAGAPVVAAEVARQFGDGVVTVSLAHRYITKPVIRRRGGR